jgi:hypothetical protein
LAARPNRRSDGDVENFCWHVRHMNWEMRVRGVGRVVCGRSGELLRAAVKKERRGGMAMDGGGGGEKMERVGRWCSAKVAVMK